MLAEVAELEKLDLEAKKPDISGSLRMLLKQQGRGEDEPGLAQEEQEPAVDALQQESAEQKPVEEASKPADGEESQPNQEQLPEKGGQEQADAEEKPAANEQKDEP
jgi:hypothetical protein